MKALQVLVTGAGSGIGAATARLFSENGYEVILTARNVAALEKVASTLPHSSHIIPAELTRADEVEALATRALEVCPELSTIINCAGIYEVKSFADSPDDFWRKMIDVNLMGPIRVIRELLPQLKKTKGVVVNVGSTAGYRPRANGATYATSKAALISLTQSLALEFAPDRVRFHCVCPGIVETPIHKLSTMTAEEINATRKKWSEYVPLGRAGRPKEIAQAIYNLARSEAEWMTGVVLPVDGGVSLE